MESFTFTDESKGSVRLDRDNLRASVSGDCEFGNVFGNNILSMNTNIIYNYKFKINELSDTIYLGLINQDSINQLNGYQPFTYNGCGFALRDDGNLYSPQSTTYNEHDPYYIEKAVNGEFKTGDIIKMTLDTVKKKLIFRINNGNDITINMDNDSSDDNDNEYRIAAYVYASEAYDEEESGITLCSYSFKVYDNKQDQDQDQKMNDKQEIKDVNEEKLESIIRNLRRINENKDKAIQELQETNDRQQEAISFLKEEMQRMMYYYNDLPSQKEQEQKIAYDHSSLYSPYFIANDEKKQENKENEENQKKEYIEI